MHVFEKAGLGTAPFKLINVEEAGCKCDFCGTPIKYEFTIQSSDDEKFIVGSRCVFKTNDSGLTHSVKRAIKLEKQRKEREKLELLPQLLNRAHVCAKLFSLPHPKMYNKTCLDYAYWIMDNAGKTGKLKLFGSIKSHCPELLDFKATDEQIQSYQRPPEIIEEPKTEWQIKVALEARSSTFQGEIGDSIDVTARLDFSKAVDGPWGPSTVYRFVDESNNVYSVFARNLQIERGCQYLLQGIVKDHNVFRECKQTVLKRVKVIREVFDSPEPHMCNQAQRIDLE
jgi:hypothetical protein